MWKAINDGASAGANFIFVVLVLIFGVLVYFAIA